MPPELLAQFPIAEQAIEALGVDAVADGRVRGRRRDRRRGRAVRRRPRRRADPHLHARTRTWPSSCEGERIVLWDRRRETIYDDAGVRTKWGVAPESVPDRLALVGDAADGFPGLPGWGDKGASAVLARYGHLEDIPANGSEWDVKGLRGAVDAGRDPPGPDGRTRSCTATSPACGPSTTACRSRSRTSRSCAGWAPSARRWEAFCDEWDLPRLRDRPHAWRDA